MHVLLLDDADIKRRRQGFAPRVMHLDVVPTAFCLSWLYMGNKYLRDGIPFRGPLPLAARPHALY